MFCLPADPCSGPWVLPESLLIKAERKAKDQLPPLQPHHTPALVTRGLPSTSPLADLPPFCSG